MHPTGLSARWRGWTTRAERERSCSSSDLRRVAPIGCAAAPCHSPGTATHRGVGYGTTTSARTAGRRPRAPVLARRRVRADARNRAERVRFGVDTGVPVCSECVGKGSGMMIDRSKRLRCVTRAMHMCNNMVEVFGRVRPRDSRACAAAPCDSPGTAKHRGVGYGTTTSARTAGRRPRAPVLGFGASAPNERWSPGSFGRALRPRLDLARGSRARPVRRRSRSAPWGAGSLQRARLWGVKE